MSCFKSVPLCLFLYFVGVIQAAPIMTTTTTTITTTNDSVEAPSFTTRTIWTIIASSVFTLFACIYSAIHPNIPSPKDSPLLILWRRLGIMIVALIAPELIVTWAMRQWFSAHYTWTQEHSFFVLMGGFMLYVDGKPYHTLQPDELLKLIRAGCIDAPTLTVKQIHDKSKGNAISKGLTILQVVWFVVQLITRAIYHLETTQLEVGTLAFAVLNFLTYAVWWNKPLGVQCPHPVYWKSTDVPENDQVAERGILFPVCRSIEELIGSPQALTPLSRKLRVPTFDGSIEIEASNLLVLLLVGFLMVTIFGGIHCMAWFFTFPTYEEQVLWRMSAAAITLTPLFGFLTLLLSGFPVYAVLYAAGRAILLVLMFTTLRNLPPDAYKAVSWTSLVPHL
ncbi:hypothetical protein DFJ58DRAFT_710140 [Suillus subalutaceus]|uniref:uncharacterized protein n=1 Tax=Suillus subalutaceus TaxID=48586 RepID=UPI001B87770C|nr:uncharacterized protein DFJ58DRAFT_710140 [Suillus subalutaceus]KAG1836409.1 hypothetical protein DFJ58DRAFT_710140 [Suillus subalutaceus]